MWLISNGLRKFKAPSNPNEKDQIHRSNERTTSILTLTLPLFSIMNACPVLRQRQVTACAGLQVAICNGAVEIREATAARRNQTVADKSVLVIK